MYLAVKEFGNDLSRKIALEKEQNLKWKEVELFLKQLEIKGLHVESRYDSMGLKIENFPDSILSEYRITMHKNGLNTLYNDDEYEIWDKEFESIFNTIKKYNKIEDLSFHPPVTTKNHPFFLDNLSNDERVNSQRLLKKLILKWIPIFKEIHVTLSLESHISEKFFIFYGPDEYIDFINSIDDLYALLDVAHNHYDRYSNEYLIKKLKGKISGLHISDAIQGENFREDIHREVGKGDIDFSFIENLEINDKTFFAFEIKKNKEEIINSVSAIKKQFNHIFNT
ncbi:MAG: sugar phosphate isomerase/epimerase [Candidatus Delongbacteria bacterium]|nr:sugar phosphate isomerase/epimerase [Candidatus Delongbacteria bacterium]MBN2834865.1 sugar phosphate isomerase/epimerase [Candidatus Delongbacteria bacterium]